MRVCSSGSAAGETVKYMELYLAQAPVHDSDCEYSCAVRFAFAEGINKNSRSYARAALIGLLTAAVLLQLRQCCVTFTQMKLSDGFALWWRNS